jgi:hypothetical protein
VPSSIKYERKLALSHSQGGMKNMNPNTGLQRDSTFLTSMAVDDGRNVATADSRLNEGHIRKPSGGQLPTNK